MWHFWAQNSQICPEQNFLVPTIIITFIYILAFFIVQDFKKILTGNPELRGCLIFGSTMVHLPQANYKKKRKLLTAVSSTYWLLSFCKLLKKNLEPIQSYEKVPFSGPKYPNLSWTNLFWYKPLLLLLLPIGP